MPPSSRSRRAALIVAVLLLAAALPPAGAAVATERFMGLLTPSDRQRMENFDTVRAEAIDEATRGGDAREVAELGRILAGDARPGPVSDFTGRWRCRTAKLGGNLPLVIYTDFDCRITAAPDGTLRFEKLTGSQRTAGTLHPVDTSRYGYAGSSWYGYEKGPKPYGADHERDEVGYLVRVAPGRLRLELPSPRQESRFDVMELRRR